MPISIKPIDATLGAIITDVSLASLDEATWADIHAAFLQYGVLVFPGQHRDAAAQGRFAARFGALEQMSPRGETPTFPIANIKADGSLAGPSDDQYRILKGNEAWHTDSTYMPLASKAAMLSAVVLPPAGGETEFADMRAAWDALDPATQQRLEGLAAYHSNFYSQARMGFTHRVDQLYSFHDKGAPLRPVVKVHPETGRKLLYVNHSYTVGFEGMTEAESKPLLNYLLDHGHRPEFTCRFRWEPGSVAFWDNRVCKHLAVHDAGPYKRMMRRIQICGTRPV